MNPYKCKLCGMEVGGSMSKRREHLLKYHQVEIAGVYDLDAQVFRSFFLKNQPVAQPADGNKYRCSLCKKIFDNCGAELRNHFISCHAKLLEKYGLTPKMAASLYAKPIRTGVLPPKVEEEEPQKSQERTNKIIKPIFSADDDTLTARISKIGDLLEGVRGHRENIKHRCLCCKFWQNDCWEYSIPGYPPIYLCDSCHRKIKCENFSSNRLIYTSFETGKKKH